MMPAGVPARCALALLLLTVGCGDGGEEARSGSEDAAERGSLVVGTGPDVARSGAFQARLGVYPLNVNVGESLTRLSPDFRIEPSLALRWEYRGDATWRFHLRPNVRFHDGSLLRAGDVEESIESMVEGGFGYSFLADDAVAVVDDSTVDLRTVRPNLRLPAQLSHPNYSIFASGTDPGTHPVGTGPFRFVEYRPDERFVVSRFEEYWGEGARIDTLVFQFHPDANTRFLSLLSGEVDLVMDVPREQLPTLTSSRRDLTVHRSPVGQMMNLHVNGNGEPPYDILRDREVRRAVALAVDRREIIREIWNGEGRPVQNVTVPAVLAPHDSLIRGVSHDPSAARELLDDAGWRRGGDGGARRNSRGRPLRLILLSNPELNPAVGELLQAQLARVGIDIRIPPTPEVGGYAERVYGGEFDLNLTDPNQNDGDPLFLPALVFYSESGRPFARWHAVGPRYDSLIEAGLEIRDPDGARRIAAEAIHLALDEEHMVISLAGRYRIYATGPRIAGFEPHPSQTNQSWARIERVP